MYDVRSLNDNTGIYLDASLNDLSVCYNGLVYTLCISSTDISYTITLLPMVIVVVALEMWASCGPTYVYTLKWLCSTGANFRQLYLSHELVKVMHLGYCSVVK